MNRDCRGTEREFCRGMKRAIRIVLVLLLVAVLVGCSGINLSAPKTARPTATAEYTQQQYVDDLLGAINDLSTITNKVGKLLDRAGDDPTAMFSDSWQSDMTKCSRDMLRRGRAIRALSPPDGTEGIHMAAVAMVDCTDDYAHCIDDLVYDASEEDIDAIVADLKNMNRKIGKATQAVSAISDEIELMR